MEDAAMLAEVEELLRVMPSRDEMHQETPENLSWTGRVAAVLNQWNTTKAIVHRGVLDEMFTGNAVRSSRAIRKTIVILNEARHDLRMKVVAPSSVAVDSGMVFDYFDEIRKVIEPATDDVYFIDPYLDAEFITRYLPHINNDVKIRLLTSNKKLDTLQPSVEAFIQQNSSSIELRVRDDIHDRYVLVDGGTCHQSGASFKDGAKVKPTTLTQIVDAFDGVKHTYEGMWESAEVVI